MTERPAPPQPDYPAHAIDLARMNRSLRHRLRNHCAGLKLTTESLQRAAADDPARDQKCSMMLDEIGALHTMTVRMDWLFDDLPAPTEGPWADLAETAAAGFRSRFPRCRLSLDGPVDPHPVPAANWLAAVLRELLANAGEAAGPDGDVSLMWHLDGGMAFSVVNAGSVWPEAVPTDPPVPFTSTRGQHVGIGLPIVHRICRALQWHMDVSMPAAEVVAVRIRSNGEDG